VPTRAAPRIDLRSLLISDHRVCPWGCMTCYEMDVDCRCKGLTGQMQPAVIFRLVGMRSGGCPSTCVPPWEGGNKTGEPDAKTLENLKPM
jgi:hypothetical protein